MKLEKDSITNNLSVLFNLSFSFGVFPDTLKIAKDFTSFFKKIKKNRMLQLQTNFVSLKSR